MAMNSAEVSGGDTLLATDHNKIRDDILTHAGDYATSGGSANAYTLTLDAAITDITYTAGMVVKFKANFTNTGAATLNVNAQGAKTIKRPDGKDLYAREILSGQIAVCVYDGTNFQLISTPALPPLEIRIVGAQGTLNAGGGTPNWLQLFDQNRKLLTQHNTTATTLNYIQRYGMGNFLNLVTARAGLSVSVDMGCKVLDGSTEYLIAMAEGGSAAYRYDPDGQNETLITFSGTAPTAARRIGWDEENGHIWIQDGADMTATQIRRYTFAGSTLTNIASDITLGTAPSITAAPNGNMYIGDDYMVLHDDSGVSPIDFRRYNKSTGVLVDTLSPTFDGASSGAGYRGMAISSDNWMYLIVHGTTTGDEDAFLSLWDIGKA